MGESVVDLSHEKIVQFSLVVKDVEKTARRFAQIFGIRLKLYSLRLNQTILHDRSTNHGCDLRLAIGNLGGRSIKLIQPVSGPSAFAEFLEHSGEGFYSIGLGVLLNHDAAVSALSKAGIGVELQGESDHGSKFTIMEAIKDLGCRIELCSPEGAVNDRRLQNTGIILPDSSGIARLEHPVLSGGKKINQVGLVVSDEKRAAEKFEELLGIKGWTYDYGPPNLVNAYMNDEPVPPPEMESLDVAFAMGWLGDLQIEIIRPIGLRPGGCHQRFLDRNGNGIQHVSFGIQGDYAEVVAAMNRAGIGSEFRATIRDYGVSACYFATQDQLGGFQLEIVGKTGS
jgi:methylmalonyl-CoA/ethylmalonyl-CoA epimerase